MAEKFELSRRKILAGLGTIGVASAGVGLGTSAYFSDKESFENNQLVAGELDLKVGWQEHYSNWMDDDYDPYPGQETTYAEMPDSGETPDVFLPAGPDQSGAKPIELVFVDPPGDDGGSDSRPDEDDGGRQFLRNTKRSDVNGGIYGGPESLCDTDADVDDQVLIEVEDLKPGDWGFAYFRLQLCDNPGYLWLTGGLESANENGVTEPEADDPDEDYPDGDTVELLDEVQVAYGVGTTNDIAASQPANPNPEFDTDTGQFTTQSTLREFLSALSDGQGIPLDGDIAAEEGGGTGRECFSGTTDHYLSVFWWLPIDHGNQVQSDSATFDLGFYTEQCRHNDGEGMATTTDVTTYTGEGWAKIEENFNGDETKSAGARARFGNNGSSGSWELAVGDRPGDDGFFNQANYVWDSGTTVDWEVVYDADADEISFTFDGNSVPAYTLAEQPDGRIAVQGKADEATVEFGNVSLSIDGAAAPLSGPTDLEVTNDGGGRDIEYLLIESTLDGESSFTLTGTATVTLQGDYPGGEEDVAFDVVIE